MASIIELIKKIEKRPAMYIGENSISCLKAFLDGWQLALDYDYIDSLLFQEFQSWVELKYGLPNTRGWHSIILFHSQDQPDALCTFFELFNDYLNERNQRGLGVESA